VRLTFSENTSGVRNFFMSSTIDNTQSKEFLNELSVIKTGLNMENVSRVMPWAILPARTLLFALTQALIALIYWLSGTGEPWQASIRWWPVHVIITNVVLLMLLARLMRQEGGRLADLWSFDKSRLGKDLLSSLGWALVVMPFGALGFIGAAYLLYGGQMPEYVFPLPLWAALLSLLVFPITIALAELPTYLGYAQTRLEALTGKSWLAVLLPAFWLAAQHSTLPLIFDWRFIFYRFLMMVPMAVVLGLVYRRTGRLFPLLVLHFLLDLQLGVMIFAMSL
jgi:membrane protease YdiL (CAAX protease family)